MPNIDDRVKRFFSEVPEPPGDVLDVLDDSLYEAARDIDPSLAVRSVARIRLIDETGEGTPGWVSMTVQEKVAANSCKQVAAALGPEEKAVEVGLIGVRTGSAVLEFAPRPETQEPSDDGMLRLARADDAMRRVIEIDSLFEDEVSGSLIRAKLDGNGTLLRATERLMDGLDDCHMTMAIRWNDSQGNVRRSEVTDRARRHAKAVFTRTPLDGETTVEGYVTALDLAGSAALAAKPGAKKGRTRVTMNPEQAAELAASLGRWVHLRVRRVDQVTDVGLRSRESYRFIAKEDLGSQETLTEASSSDS
jgi:hypothetical protein